MKKKKEKEPQFIMSPTGIEAVNYRVLYLSPVMSILYFLIAFIIGAAVGYLFYGGIGKDSFGNPTTVTYVCNVIFMGGTGFAAGCVFLPLRTKQLLNKRKRELNTQFRDFLETFNTSLGAGKTVVDSINAAYDDMKIQYESGAHILNELAIIKAGMANNIDLEVLFTDFGDRSGNDDIISFANVFAISYHRGGNMKDTIRNTYDILNDKIEINEDIETMITANKNELNVMMVMPIALIGIIKTMSPEFGGKFVTFTGIIATTIAVVMFVAAYFVGQKIMNIKV